MPDTTSHDKTISIFIDRATKLKVIVVSLTACRDPSAVDELLTGEVFGFVSLSDITECAKALPSARELFGSVMNREWHKEGDG